MQHVSILLALACTPAPISTPGSDVGVDALDSDLDGVPNVEDCAPQDPELWEDRVVSGTLTGSALATACEGACSLRAEHIEFTGTEHDLEALSCLTRVDRDFHLVELQYLGSLRGLERLERVDGTFEIRENPVLMNLRALEGLHSVRTLVVEGNPELNSLEGLEGLSSVESGLIVRSLPIVTLSGLDGLRSVGSLILNDLELDSLRGLEALETAEALDLDGITLYGGFAALESLESLRSLEFTAGIATFEGWPDIEVHTLRLGATTSSWPSKIPTTELSELHVRGLRSLSASGFGSLPTFESQEMDWVFLYDTQLTDLKAFDGLKVVQVGLTIEGNVSLTSLHGLEDLVSVGELRIADSGSSYDVASLRSLEQVTGDLTLQDLGELHSLYGLDQLREVGGDLRLTNLAVNDVDALYGLERIGGHFAIEGLDIDQAEMEALVQSIGEENIEGGWSYSF